MKWWMEHKFRMIQNNIRDIDAKMDIDYEIEKLKEFGADVVQIGCGGISAFSRTGLDCQRPSPYLTDDMFKNFVEKCHGNQIRVIARFDVSKVHVSLGEKHPQWLTRRKDGSAVYFNDTAATCINGEYQQEKTLEIIREILKKYPVDGIFFNMFGYVTRDYDRQYIGICQCENCKRRFYEWSGLELPSAEDKEDPASRKYEEFKEYTVRDILEKIHGVIDSINPDIALSTYASHRVDIIRTESNSAVDRPYPFWIYSASDNTASVEHTFSQKVSSNCAINAVDIPYRFMGVSPYLNRIRLYQNLANGSNLDWCIIGAFEDYPDRNNFDGVKEVFHFQKLHQRYFDAFERKAGILLVQPQNPYHLNFKAEYRGMFRILKEAHLQFDVVMEEELDREWEPAREYSLVILPDVKGLKDSDFFRKLTESDTAVLATGASLRETPETLGGLFGQVLGGKVEKVRGSYFKTSPKEIFSSFRNQDWVYLDREFYEMEGEGERILPYISAAMYGPPERCFGHQVTKLAGAVIYKDNKIYLPWYPASLYYQHGYESFKQLILDLLRKINCMEEDFETDAHDSVELFWNPCGEGRYLLQLINLSGFNGTTAGREIPQYGISVKWKNRIPRSVRELTGQGETEVSAGNILEIPVLNVYRAYVVEFETKE
ncbi:MAG: family 10 glycosylhydrolase [Hungatella sp.]|nr:family 10 glycosylhydrolase [Hungatella sp.]